MAQQPKVSQYTFSQLVQAVEELKKVTEQLNDNSKNLDLRLMILEGKAPPANPSLGTEASEDDQEEAEVAGGPSVPDVPMSTSELAIQKEADRIAELEKAKEKQEKEAKEKQEQREAREKQDAIRKNSNFHEKQKVNKQDDRGISRMSKQSPEKPKEKTYVEKRNITKSKPPLPTLNGTLQIKSEPKEVSETSSSSSSSMDLDDLLNIQKDLLHIETDETWEMPVIQSVTSVKQESLEEVAKRVKVEPGLVASGLSETVQRIENEILAQVRERIEDGGETGKTLEMELDPKTGTMKKPQKRKANDLSIAVNQKDTSKIKKVDNSKRLSNTPKVRVKEESSSKVKETTRDKSPKKLSDTDTTVSRRSSRKMVPVKFENFEMKKEFIDDYPQDTTEPLLDDSDFEEEDENDDDDNDEAEEMLGSQKDKLYCKCRSLHNKNQPMIGCDGPCEDWYHFSCVGIPQNFRSIADWYCETCFYKLTKGSIEVCICGGFFEAAHELVRCKSTCGRLYHPGCLGLDHASKVIDWEGGGGHCGYCMK